MKNLLLFLFVAVSLSVNAQNKELTTFYDSGVMKSRYVYTNAQNYTVSNYSTTGKLIEKGSFVNGKMDGVWTSYNESGVKTAEAYYTNGNKSGDWRIFDETGNLRYVMSYDSNKLVHATNFDAAGKTVAETHTH
ncbi:MAG TPA: hypothetical protein PL185_10160 [Flavobacteriales bacterium]|nr:hypothetical protein [Flavobacteriales bacterium]